MISSPISDVNLGAIASVFFQTFSPFSLVGSVEHRRSTMMMLRFIVSYVLHYRSSDLSSSSCRGETHPLVCMCVCVCVSVCLYCDHQPALI